jgi:glycosyltransferase involved in cell wall biosynthesis
MKIYLLLNQPYPNGYALTKRFHLYAKGLIRNGHEVKMIIPHPTEYEDNLGNKSISGIFEEVKFEYKWRSTKRSHGFLMRRYHDITGGLKAGLTLIKERPDVVVTSSFSFIFFLYIKLISLLFPFKFYHEKNEVDYMHEDNISYMKKLLIKLNESVFHGFVVINSHLLNYITNELKLKKSNIIVPILIEDFKVNKEFPVNKTIVYTGTYQERKDGILTILNGFAKIKNRYPEFKLVLTGSPQRSVNYKEILKIIEANEMWHQVYFTGYLSEEDLKEVLVSANMLVLAKPENRQNNYNFPTKLGEYLISGRPVITTKVGVTGEILEDKINVVFSEFEISDISRKMEFIMNNPELATEIGTRGREYALKHFDYMVHTKRMADHFQTSIENPYPELSTSNLFSSLKQN